MTDTTTANNYLEQFSIQSCRSDLPVVKRLRQLPRKIRETAVSIYNPDEENCRIDLSKSSRLESLTWIKQISALSPEDTRALFAALVPKIHTHVDNCWQMLKGFPYQVSENPAVFRAPRDPDISLNSRCLWLDTIVFFYKLYDEDIIWYARQAGNISLKNGLRELGLLFAAAINNDPDSSEIFDILRASANGEHPVGKMGRHVTQAMLSCENEKAWIFAEALLLSSMQREEIRQSILETACMADKQAFKRILRLILKHNLTRFRPVSKLINSWYGIHQSDSDTALAKFNVEQSLADIEDNMTKIKAFNSSDPRQVYISLCSYAFEDVTESVNNASRLLREKSSSLRFTGAYFLNILKLNSAIKVAVPSLYDEDLHVSSEVLRMLADGSYTRQTSKNIFGHLVKNFERYPRQPRDLEPVLWQMPGRKISRTEIADAIYANAGPDHLDKIVDYIPSMSRQTQRLLAEEMANRKIWKASYRQIVLKLLRHSSRSVRSVLLENISKLKINLQSVLKIEPLLKRKTPDLRNALISILLKQDDRSVFSSADRLLCSSNELMQLAGIEILELMIKKHRMEQNCILRAKAYLAAADQLPQSQQAILDQILQSSWEIPTLSNALGLADISKRTSAKPLTRHNMSLASQAADKCIESLDKLIDDINCRDQSVSISSLKNPDRDLPAVKDVERLDFAEQWRNWAQNRPGLCRDLDGQELIRLYVQSHMPIHHGRENWTGQNIREICGSFSIFKASHPGIIKTLSSWMIKLYPGDNDVSFILDAAETVLAMIPRGKEEKWLRKNSFPYLHWYDMAQAHFRNYPEKWAKIHKRRLWNLSKWIDEPVVIKTGLFFRKEQTLNIHLTRKRPGYIDMLSAFIRKDCSEADIFDSMIGPRNNVDPIYAMTQQSFDMLSELTCRNIADNIPCNERIKAIADQCRQRIIDIELLRGENPTEAAEPACALRSVEGIDNLINILNTLDKDPMIHSLENMSKQEILSRLVRISYPEKTGTSKEFRKKIKQSGIKEGRLIELAVFAPQWAGFIEAALGCKGLEDCVWWIHAHCLENILSFNEMLKYRYAAEISKRTCLSVFELSNGSVDVQWFRNIIETAGRELFEKIAEHAGLSADSSCCKRMTFFVDVMLGKTSKQQVMENIHNKRDTDSICALGLIPLSPENSRQDFLERDYLIQEFIRTSGLVKNANRYNEVRAAQTAMDNLYRSAGLSDSMQAQMEKKFGGYLNSKSGEHELQDKHASDFLEKAMCTGKRFSRSELMNLMVNRRFRSMLTKLVLIGKDSTGLPDEKGQALKDFSGQQWSIGPDEQLRIAHARDLHNAGLLESWQNTVVKDGIVQPFEQIFRRVFFITDKESNPVNGTFRFSGRRVRSVKAFDKLIARGWTLDPDRGIFKNTPEYDISAWADFRESLYGKINTDGVTVKNLVFITPACGDEIPLISVPAIIFSETIRDIYTLVN